MLQTYNPALVPTVFTFRNTGVLCYINSLLQSLLSLPSFNSVNSSSPLFSDILSRNSPSHPSLPPQISTEDSTPTLNSIIAKSNGAIRAGRQEDAHEGFQLLVDILDSHAPSTSKLFHIRYSTTITCLNPSCRHSHRVSYEEPPELWVDIHWEISTRENTERHIKSQSETIPDYTCEKCHSSGVSKRRSLRRLSEIIVLTFKNYPQFTQGKKKHYFPSSLSFASVDGTLNYSAVAKIDHSGTESGGHYTSVVRRRVHPLTHAAYIARLRQSIASDPTGSRAYKARLRQNENAEFAAFRLNDNLASYYPTRDIRPSTNTYMVFYHLMSVTDSE
jgi:ubiquitin C-terminal hydrolase